MMTTGGSSTAFSGSSTAVRPGATCRGTTVGSGRCRAGSTAGAGLAYGSTCWRRCRPWPMPRGGSAGSCTSWTARSFALGRSRGGFTTKIHLRCEGYGKPVIFTVTGGQVHDTRQVSALISRGAIRRIGRGRPRLRPAKLVGDKAYSSRSIRLALRRRGIIPVIPTKANERRQPDFDREAELAQEI
jgi:hypothetical protein